MPYLYILHGEKWLFPPTGTDWTLALLLEWLEAVENNTFPDRSNEKSSKVGKSRANTSRTSIRIKSASNTSPTYSTQQASSNTHSDTQTNLHRQRWSMVRYPEPIQRKPDVPEVVKNPTVLPHYGLRNLREGHWLVLPQLPIPSGTYQVLPIPDERQPSVITPPQPAKKTSRLTEKKTGSLFSRSNTTKPTLDMIHRHCEDLLASVPAYMFPHVNHGLTPTSMHQLFDVLRCSQLVLDEVSALLEYSKDSASSQVAAKEHLAHFHASMENVHETFGGTRGASNPHGHGARTDRTKTHRPTTSTLLTNPSNPPDISLSSNRRRVVLALMSVADACARAQDYFTACRRTPAKLGHTSMKKSTLPSQAPFMSQPSFLPILSRFLDLWLPSFPGYQELSANQVVQVSRPDSSADDQLTGTGQAVIKNARRYVHTWQTEGDAFGSSNAPRLSGVLSRDHGPHHANLHHLVRRLSDMKNKRPRASTTARACLPPWARPVMQRYKRAGLSAVTAGTHMANIPLPPEDVYGRAKEAFLDALLVTQGRVISDDVMVGLIDKVIEQQEGHAYGPHGIYPRVLVKERLCREFSVQYSVASLS